MRQKQIIPWLDGHASQFPPVHTAARDPNGLLAVGGDLSRERLLTAYRRGIFPWYNPGEPILWWSPDPRTVIFPEKVHISRSLRKHIRRSNLKVTFDRAFDEVIRACAAPRDYCNSSWITPAIKCAYADLHSIGIAHSVEIWQDDQLIGGLYGLGMGKLFFGESMFHRETDASKVAFVALCKQLSRWGYVLVDCQVGNSHLRSLGAKEIERAEFMRYLNKYLSQEIQHDWEFSSIETLMES